MPHKWQGLLRALVGPGGSGGHFVIVVADNSETSSLYQGVALVDPPAAHAEYSTGYAGISEPLYVWRDIITRASHVLVAIFLK